MPYWPGKKPKPKASLGPPMNSVVVQIEAGGDAGVARRHIAIWIIDGSGAVVGYRKVVVLEQLGRYAAGVVVELVDQQHLGADTLNDLGDRCCLRVARRRQIGDQLAPR